MKVLDGNAVSGETYRTHAEALYEALCREFDGFEDGELLVGTTEALRRYREFRKEPAVRSLLATSVRVCPACGGSGTVTL